MGDNLATQADWATTGRKYKVRPERGVEKNIGSIPVAQMGVRGRRRPRGRRRRTAHHSPQGVELRFYKPAEWYGGIVR
jgi:hypothetical protein